MSVFERDIPLDLWGSLKVVRRVFEDILEVPFQQIWVIELKEFPLNICKASLEWNQENVGWIISYCRLAWIHSQYVSTMYSRYMSTGITEWNGANMNLGTTGSLLSNFSISLGHSAKNRNLAFSDFFFGNVNSQISRGHHQNREHCQNQAPNLVFRNFGLVNYDPELLTELGRKFRVSSAPEFELQKVPDGILTPSSGRN
jgi:hypothetical protein